MNQTRAWKTRVSVAAEVKSDSARRDTIGPLYSSSRARAFPQRPFPKAGGLCPFLKSGQPNALKQCLLWRVKRTRFHITVTTHQDREYPRIAHRTIVRLTRRRYRLLGGSVWRKPSALRLPIITSGIKRGCTALIATSRTISTSQVPNRIGQIGCWIE